jgi:cation:H+ antiporter
LIDLALLFLGLILVALFAKLTLDHAIVVAHRFNIPDFYMGALVLAIGSDLPELVVTLNAAIRNLGTVDTSGLIIGNAIGSCFGQIGLSLGVAGCFGYLTIARKYMLRHGQVLLGSLVVLFLTGLDGAITRIEGAALTAFYLLYVFSLLDGAAETERNHHPGYKPLRTWSMLLVGMAGVVIAAELIVRGAMGSANAWGVSQSFIAIAIIGVGTSIPELSISIAALAKARGGMSVGNIIGSNILDTLLPVGLAGLIAPMVFESGLLWFDLPALFALSALVFFFFMRKRGLQRREAMTLVGVYAAYILTKLASA